MPSKAVALFDPGAMPAHIAAANQQPGGNVITPVQVNKLTYAGRVWTVTIDGVKTPIMRLNQEGDEEPRPTIPVIIVDAAARRGRAYFTGGFDPAAVKQPDCWSADGITPDPKAPGVADANGKRFDKCAECPMSVKGSKITEANKETTACQQHRRMVVALRGQPELPLLQLQISITADYDATSTALMEKNIFAWAQYMKYLKSKGVGWTCSLVTRLRFDTTLGINYPKVMFEPIGFTTPDEFALYQPMVGTQEVEDIMHPPFDGAPPAPSKPLIADDADEEGPVVLPAAARAPTPAAGKPAATPGKPAAGTAPRRAAPPPPPEEEPAAEEDEQVDPDADPDGAGEEASAEDIVAENEADGGEPETRAQQLAREAVEKAAAAQATKNAKAKLEAASRRNAAVVDGAAGDDDGDNVTIMPTKPTGKPAAVAAGKAASAPATKPAVVVAGKATAAATKPAAAPPAAKAAGAKVNALLADWPAD